MINMNLRQSLIGFLLLFTSSFTVADDQDVFSIVKANFEAADVNGDSNLDATEFRALINANAESDIGRSRMVKRFGAYDRAFNTADQNGDGLVAWSEIIANRPH